MRAVSPVLSQQCVLVADLDLHTLDRRSDAGGNVVLDTVVADNRAGLGQTVALQHGQAEADEDSCHIRRQRGAAADGRSQASPQARQDLVRHQLLQQRPEDKARTPRPAPLLMLEARPSHLGRQLEQLAAHGWSLRQLGLDCAIHALVDARHGNEQRGPDGREILPKLRDGASVSHACACHHAEIVPTSPLESM